MPYAYDSARDVVFVDYTNLTAEQLVAEAHRVHDEGRLHLAGRRARVLVDITGAKLSRETVQALKESTKNDSEMVERTAIVGVTGLKRILADAIARFSGTNTSYFDTKEEALEWLMKP